MWAKIKDSYEARLDACTVRDHLCRPMTIQIYILLYT